VSDYQGLLQDVAQGGNSIARRPGRAGHRGLAEAPMSDLGE
ncbi:unnamed protein product, partial [Acidithrix sp. C25]